MPESRTEKEEHSEALDDQIRSAHRSGTKSRQLVCNAGSERSRSVGSSSRSIECSGARPSCHRCLQNDVDCKWDTEPDTSRLVSIRKRKEELERENEDLHEFLRFLISRPEEEAFEIFKRLRASGDALEVLNFVRTADLLLQRRQVGDDVNQETPKETTAEREEDLPVSHFKVPAKPWTNLANDIIVSDLITSFFLWEAPFFLPFVDQQTFLDDMRGCSPETATHCSPLLVHAICALRSNVQKPSDEQTGAI
ncbi:hypothetical protein K4K53_013270 [Colletotrichum sp. SAR 10_77]|nr:hypothetical protein K4K53_013270 [Colletotrichum sp. SAR 10_77]